MELIIELKNNQCWLELVKKGNGVDAENFSYYHDLDDKLTPLEATYLKRHGYIMREKTRVYKELLTGLISAIDKMSKRNNIDVTTIKDYKIRENLGENATSVKIAEAVVEGLKV